MTIGDILAVIAAIVSIGASWAATILAGALLFPARAERAKERLSASPGRIFLRGLLVTAGAAIVAGVVNSTHSGPTQLLAGAIISALLLASALGSAGIVRLVAERIGGEAGQSNSFVALTRAAGLYVAAGFLPVVGWFVIAPLALVFSVGAADAALFSGREKPVLIGAPISASAPSIPPAAEPSL